MAVNSNSNLRFYVILINMKQLLAFILWFSLIGAASASLVAAEQAFSLSATLANNVLTVNFHVAPGYHLYRQRITFSSSTLMLKPASIPAGKNYHDPDFGQVKILNGNFSVRQPIVNPAPQETVIYVGYQGCSDTGICYAPNMKKLIVQISPVGQRVVEITNAHMLKAPKQAVLTEQYSVTQLISRHNSIITLLILFSLGVLLAFTPCVLPMVPILSGILLGQKKLSTTKAFLLSLVYVIAMALTYAIAGVLVGALGASVQASLQQPWVMIFFIILFIVLALSMFGLFELRLPTSIMRRLTAVSQTQKSGQWLGVASMGVISALVLSPCVSAPLVGVLSYIASTGNACFGGLALFVLALGMGVPLLIVAVLGVKFLPRNGKWMLRVKHFCGLLLLLVAVYLAARMIPWGGKQHQLHFIQIQNQQQLTQQLAKAKGQPVMVDFYADWCIACKVVAHQVFSNQQVQKKLNGYTLLQVDVSNNTQNNKLLEKQLHVYGPPTIIFYNKYGQREPAKRLVGDISIEQFLKAVNN